MSPKIYVFSQSGFDDFSRVVTGRDAEAPELPRIVVEVGQEIFAVYADGRLEGLPEWTERLKAQDLYDSAYSAWGIFLSATQIWDAFGAYYARAGRFGFTAPL